MATGIVNDIAKAGWLYRQSSVLHRWKKNWFVIYRDGDLKYFESPDHPRAEERIVIRAWVDDIRTGVDCRRADPPEGQSNAKNCFLELIMRGKESLLLCAESFDDMRAWQIVLDEARTMPSVNRNQGVVHMSPPGYTTYASPYNVRSVSTYNGYSYPGQVLHVPASNTNTTVIMPAPATQQVVYMDDYPYRRRHYRSGLFMAPMFWW